MRYDLVCFDLYGTLIDIHTNEEDPLVWQQYYEWLHDQGVMFDSVQALHDRWRELVDDAIRQVVADRDGSLDSCETELYEPDFASVYQSLVGSGLDSGAGLDADAHVAFGAELAAEAAFAFRRLSTSYIHPFEGAHNLLRSLRSHGLRVALLSNAQSLYTRPELELCGFNGLFDYVQLSSEEGIRKPNPVFFKRAVGRCGVPLEKSVMIGNEINADMKGAAGAGLNAIYLNTSPADLNYPKTADEAVLSLQGANYDALEEYLLL